MYRKVHLSILKLVYINSELLHVPASHVAVFKDVKHKY